MSSQRSTGPTARWRATLPGELAAEFLGTAVLILFGTGSVAMAVSALNQSGRGTEIFQASGDWLLIGWGWGLAVTLGVYVAGGVTGAHLNPAVTLANACRRDFPWSQGPALHRRAGRRRLRRRGDRLPHLPRARSTPTTRRTTSPIGRAPTRSTTFSSSRRSRPYFHNWFGPFLDQVDRHGAADRVLFALTDERNQPPKANLAPFIVGLVVVAIGISFGANSGYAINPARDLGPRLLAGLAGWGGNAVPGDYGDISCYIWIPIVGPLIGAGVGALVYDKLIRDVLLARGAEPAADVEGEGETVEETRFAKQETDTTTRSTT